MYVNPFVAGVVVGIIATLVVIIVCAWIAGSKK
jgi:TRAP-type C4-dicarboxylate transport system permease large subunit